MIRILMVEHTGKGGLWAYTDALCQGLAECGAQVTVLTNPAWPGKSPSYRVDRRLLEFTRTGRYWTRVHWAVDRVARSLCNSLRRNRMARSGGFDVVHLQIGVPLVDQFLLRSLARRLAVVLTVHDVQPHCDRFNTRREFLRRYFHIPHRLIVHYRSGKDQLVRDWAVPEDRIEVIPHGIMPIGQVPEAGVARQQLQLPQDRKIVLFFGNIRANKGLEVLLEAMAVVCRRRSDVLAVIAGSPYREVEIEQYMRRIEELSISANVRTFIQFIPEEQVDLFFAAADLVVLPYLRFEAQSGVLLRAYAHRKPVVVSDVGAMGEQVRTDAVGVVTPAGEVAALAEGILEVLAQSDRFAAAYQQKLWEKYDWKRIAGLTIDCYKQAMQQVG